MCEEQIYRHLGDCGRWVVGHVRDDPQHVEKCAAEWIKSLLCPSNFARVSPIPAARVVGFISLLLDVIGMSWV